MTQVWHFMWNSDSFSVKQVLEKTREFDQTFARPAMYSTYVHVSKQPKTKQRTVHTQLATHSVTIVCNAACSACIESNRTLIMQRLWPCGDLRSSWQHRAGQMPYHIGLHWPIWNSEVLRLNARWRYLKFCYVHFTILEADTVWWKNESVFHHFLATWLTDWAETFTGVLFHAYAGLDKVWTRF